MIPKCCGDVVIKTANNKEFYYCQGCKTKVEDVVIVFGHSWSEDYSKYELTREDLLWKEANTLTWINKYYRKMRLILL